MHSRNNIAKHRYDSRFFPISGASLHEIGGFTLWELVNLVLSQMVWSNFRENKLYLRSTVVVTCELHQCDPGSFPCVDQHFFPFIFLISTPLQTILIAHTHTHTGKEILWMRFCTVSDTLHFTYRTALLSSETPILPTTSFMADLAHYTSNSKGKGILWLEFCSVLDTPYLT